VSRFAKDHDEIIKGFRQIFWAVRPSHRQVGKVVVLIISHPVLISLFCQIFSKLFNSFGKYLELSSMLEKRAGWALISCACLPTARLLAGRLRALIFRKKVDHVVL